MEEDEEEERGSEERPTLQLSEGGGFVWERSERGRDNRGSSDEIEDLTDVTGEVCSERQGFIHHLADDYLSLSLSLSLSGATDIKEDKKTKESCFESRGRPAVPCKLTSLSFSLSS